MIKTVKFSRLLKVFKINKANAYIIELDFNGEKINYLSYFNKIKHKFISFNEANNSQKKYFKNLSDTCLMKQCTNANYMFANSPITHFEADCSNLIECDFMFSESNITYFYADLPKVERALSMFNCSKIKVFQSQIPNLKNGNYMFFMSSLNTFAVDADNLVSAVSMFSHTNLKVIKSSFKSVQNSSHMFYGSLLERFDAKMPNIKNNKEMFTFSHLEHYPHTINPKDKSAFAYIKNDKFKENHPYLYL